MTADTVRRAPSTPGRHTGRGAPRRRRASSRPAVTDDADAVLLRSSISGREAYSRAVVRQPVFERRLLSVLRRKTGSNDGV